MGDQYTIHFIVPRENNRRYKIGFEGVIDDASFKLLASVTWRSILQTWQDAKYLFMTVEHQVEWTPS